MPISGIVITCRADRATAVASSIRDSGMAEIHGSSPEGKLVAVIETASMEEEVRIVSALARMDGVVNVQLAYHNFEDIPDPIGSC